MRKVSVITAAVIVVVAAFTVEPINSEITAVYKGVTQSFANNKEDKRLAKQALDDYAKRQYRERIISDCFHITMSPKDDSDWEALNKKRWARHVSIYRTYGANRFCELKNDYMLNLEKELQEESQAKGRKVFRRF